MSGSYVSPTLTVPVGPQDWSRGPENAPVTIVEYGDFECPHCAEMEPVLRELRQLAGNTLRVVFRHFPLTSSHPHAELAAEAAEAAGAQGAFWPMHDLLFQNQQALIPSDLVGYAAGLGLDAQQVATDLENRTYKVAVQEDFMGGVRSGVSGTPTFYINGSRYDGAYDLDSLWRAVQKAARLAR
jgi:protein-disulfide isomerase